MDPALNVLNYWNYPTGGNPYKTVAIKHHGAYFTGVTVSVAPSS